MQRYRQHLIPLLFHFNVLMLSPFLFLPLSPSSLPPPSPSSPSFLRYTSVIMSDVLGQDVIDQTVVINLMYSLVILQAVR